MNHYSTWSAQWNICSASARVSLSECWNAVKWKCLAQDCSHGDFSLSRICCWVGMGHLTPFVVWIFKRILLKETELDDVLNKGNTVIFISHTTANSLSITAVFIAGYRGPLETTVARYYRLMWGRVLVLQRSRQLPKWKLKWQKCCESSSFQQNTKTRLQSWKEISLFRYL